MLNLFPLPDPAGPGARPDRQPRQYNFRAILPQQCGRWTTRSCAWTTTSRRRCSSTCACCRIIRRRTAITCTVGPPGGAWGQFPASYHVQAAGALGTLVYTISPTLINEFSWGINRGQQGVDPLDDASANPNTGGVKTYAQSLLPLKDANGNALTLPRINQGSNYLNLLPAVNFGLPSGFSAQSSGQGVTARSHLQPGQPLAFHRHRPVADHPGQDHLGEGRAHLQGRHLHREDGAQRERVLGVQRRRNLLLRFRPRQPAGHQLSLRQRAAWAASSPMATTTRNWSTTRTTRRSSGTCRTPGRSSRRLTFDYGLRFYRVGDLNSQGRQPRPVRHGVVRPEQGRPTALPGCSVR